MKAPPIPPIQWLSAATLWDPNVKDDPVKQNVPLLLRFVSERFMEELSTRLQTPPVPDLSGLIAVPEPPPAEPKPTPELKLYLPVHGRLYLVTARLVCQIGRESDYIPNTGKGDEVGFVVRRPRATGGEDAWVSPPRHDVEPSWLEVPGDGRKRLAPHEVLFSLFPLSFGTGERRRRLLMGLVPAGSRATFAAAKPPGDGKYVIRLVWHRTVEGEGPELPPLISAPSEPFVLAELEDPDAPHWPGTPPFHKVSQAER
ncbi:hypothetical protein [Archangium violaceum]|uniref:Uncharacterized protein n=1 Tax=Archangium violaceum Cb vi76 TaxID=1406225 RepID=A0A084T0U5_9BACT|nr:hypothetical protein [Archangium violaceum]KFA94330.1 hypothetical protein Q664_03275 [Archangium violaceum Cb vi76]